MDLDALRSPASALLLARLAAEHGLPVERALAGTGLTEEALRSPRTEVTVRQELAVVRALLGVAPAVPAALAAGTRYHLTTYGIWGFALASSPTVGSALEVGLRFIDLSFAFCGFTVQAEGDEVRLVMDGSAVPPDVREFAVVRDLAGLQTLASEVFGSRMPLRRLALRLADADGPFEEVFGVRPELGAAADEAVVDAALLDLPLPQADELTRAATEQQCRDLLARRHARTGCAAQVRDVLLRSPGATPSAGEVAAALHVSERTLRRRLSDEGTGLRALLDEVREALAEELLATGGVSVEQAAHRLGYAETASFTRAFTRWKGVPPSRWVA